MTIRVRCQVHSSTVVQTLLNLFKKPKIIKTNRNHAIKITKGPPTFFFHLHLSSEPLEKGPQSIPYHIIINFIDFPNFSQVPLNRHLHSTTRKKFYELTYRTVWRDSVFALLITRAMEDQHLLFGGWRGLILSWQKGNENMDDEDGNIEVFRSLIGWVKNKKGKSLGKHTDFTSLRLRH